MIAALILFIAVFAIAPAVDAATCVPEVPSAHQVLAHDPATGDHSGQGSDPAVCAHGHCHHSAGERFSSTDYEAAGTHARAVHDLPRDDVAVSHPSDGLKRPPRA